MAFSCGQKPDRTEKTSIQPSKITKISPLKFNGVIVAIDSANAPLKRSKWQYLFGNKWTDVDGEHFVLAWKRGPLPENAMKYMEGEYFSELFIGQYVQTADSLKLEWQVQDGVRHCAFDMGLDIRNDTVFVTDLDSNGKTETSVIYQLTCRSDVSPADLKFLMFNQGQKMALRGSTFLAIAGAHLDAKTFEPDYSKLKPNKLNEYDYRREGRFLNARDFEGKPSVFFSFARTKWLEYCIEDGAGH